MKKFILFVMCFALATASVCMSKDKKVRPEKLPTTIQQFIKRNYPQSKIISVTQELDDKDYNVSLTGGTKLEFGKDNQWSEIYNKKALIPSNLLPQEIVKYVQKTYPRTSIVRIERCSQGYDIDLSNRKHFQLDKTYKATKFKEAD